MFFACTKIYVKRMVKMNLDYAIIGTRLAKTRKSQRLTQEKLAEKAGISNNYLSHIEKSKSIPSLATLMSLCSALKTTPNELLLGSSKTAESYLFSDINENFGSLNDKDKRLINNLITFLLSEKDKS